MPSTHVHVAAAIATYRRNRELVRLLDALAAGTARPSSVIVADNASWDSTRETCEKAGAKWLPRAVNNGPGAAWNAAIAEALLDPDVSHVLVLDDDVLPGPDALQTLLEVQQTTDCGAVAPLLFDDKNKLWGFPEPREPFLRNAIRRAQDPASCLALLGSTPLPFCWATGACMLYHRDAIEKCGAFREDFWMLGEDLEYSMRVAAAAGGVFTARVAIPHLPPPPEDPRAAAFSHRAKFLALLQNLSFLAFHSPHSAHLRSYLPGNFRRFLRTEGMSPGNMADGSHAFWHGAIRGRPAGTPAGAKLRARACHRMTKDRPE